MATTLEYTGKYLQVEVKTAQPKWQRIILLFVLAYEAAGCLMGGIFFLIAPDGSLMDMPISLMHGAFRDFLIPGIILFGLGILNTDAFIAVLRRTSYDWFVAGLALGGLIIWFWVEIAILRELHWLHLMWGFPVVVGSLMVIPLIPARQTIMRRVLLTAGIFSSLLYIAMNIFVPMQWAEYSSFSLSVSELSAIGAPTRPLWIILVIPYSLLVSGFGYGVLASAHGKRSLRITGGLLIAYGLVGLLWPPMHLRDVLAAGGGTLTDTMHIVFTAVTVPLMMLIMGFGAGVFGRMFRIYTIVTIILLTVFGILTSIQAPQLQANLPTPWLGVWERINIGVFMLWVIVFATKLLKQEQPAKE